MLEHYAQHLNIVSRVVNLRNHSLKLLLLVSGYYVAASNMHLRWLEYLGLEIKEAVGVSVPEECVDTQLVSYVLKVLCWL